MKIYFLSQSSKIICELFCFSFGAAVQFRFKAQLILILKTGDAQHCNILYIFFSYRQVHVYATVFNSYLLEASLLDGCSKESHWEMCGVLFTELLHAECSLRYKETTDLSKGHQHHKFKSNGIDLWDSSFSKFSVQCYIAFSMIVN